MHQMHQMQTPTLRHHRQRPHRLLLVVLAILTTLTLAAGVTLRVVNAHPAHMNTAYSCETVYSDRLEYSGLVNLVQWNPFTGTINVRLSLFRQVDANNHNIFCGRYLSLIEWSQDPGYPGAAELQDALYCEACGSNLTDGIEVGQTYSGGDAFISTGWLPLDWSFSACSNHMASQVGIPTSGPWGGAITLRGAFYCH